MKKIVGIIFALLLGVHVMAQKQLPDVQVTTKEGKSVSIRACLNDSVPVILSFWSTTCKPCLLEFDAFKDNYDEWMAEARFKVVAVSVDDARSAAKVWPMVKGKGWPFTVWLDSNENLKRAMNVSVVPSSFVLDKNGKVVYSHIGYTQGSEQGLFDAIRKLYGK